LPDDIGIFQAYFINICEKIRGIIEEMQINYDGLSDERKNAHWFLLHHGICHRISGHFQPSIVEDFDQSNLRRERNA
jgi:hypothetical protein